MLSTDRNIFKKLSPVAERMKDYGSICDELHILVIQKSKVESRKLENIGKNSGVKISQNVFAYPVTSRFKLGTLFKAYRLGTRIFTMDFGLRTLDYLVTAQDPFETGFAGWIIARAFKAKLQLQIHTDFLSPYFVRGLLLNKIRVFIAGFLLPRADSIRVVSDRIKYSLQTTNYRLKTVPSVLPIFVDAPKIMSAKPQFDLHKKYPRFDFIILTVARLEPEKNISLSLQVMKTVIKEYPRIGFVIVGDGKEMKNLKLKTIDYGLQTSVVFEGWQNELASYYKTSDLYLSTSDYEGYGLSLVEAALSGCPIVTTDVGIASYILKNGLGALVCPPGDDICIGKGIRTFLSNLELRKKVSRTAIAEALKSVPKDKQTYLLEYKKLWEACL